MIHPRVPTRSKTKKVSKQIYDDHYAKAQIARIVLEDDLGKPLLNLMDTSLKTAENAVLDNTIRSVQQEGIIEGVMSVLTRTRKEQIEELSGKYQAIRDIKAKLQEWITSYEELENLIKSGEVEIAENK